MDHKAGKVTKDSSARRAPSPKVLTPAVTPKSATPPPTQPPSQPLPQIPQQHQQLQHQVQTPSLQSQHLATQYEPLTQVPQFPAPPPDLAPAFPFGAIDVQNGVQNGMSNGMQNGYSNGMQNGMQNGLQHQHQSFQQPQAPWSNRSSSIHHDSPLSNGRMAFATTSRRCVVDPLPNET